MTRDKVSEVRYVKETTFLDEPNAVIPVRERWELNATFDERPTSIIATFKNGRTVRLDAP